MKFKAGEVVIGYEGKLEIINKVTLSGHKKFVDRVSIVGKGRDTYPVTLFEKIFLYHEKELKEQERELMIVRKALNQLKQKRRKGRK